MFLKILKRFFNLEASLRGDMVWIGDSNDTIPIAVNGVTTVFSKIFPSYYFDNIGISLILSGTSPNITITVEQGAQPPATANINASDPNFAVGAGVAAICTALTSKTVQIQTLSLVPMKWSRLKIVGNAGNSSDATVKIGIFEQELVV